MGPGQVALLPPTPPLGGPVCKVILIFTCQLYNATRYNKLFDIYQYCTRKRLQTLKLKLQTFPSTVYIHYQVQSKTFVTLTSKFLAFYMYKNFERTLCQASIRITTTCGNVFSPSKLFKRFLIVSFCFPRNISVV